jgi:hypothetical protein
MNPLLTRAIQGLQELAEPWPAASKVKEAINRASRLAGLSYTRASDIWYGKARSIRECEIDQIEAAIDKKRLLEARNELKELRSRLTRIETLIEQDRAQSSRARPGLLGPSLRGSR